MAIYLTEADVRALLTVDAAIAAVAEGLTELAAGAVCPLRQRVDLPGVALRTMAAALPGTGALGCKAFVTGNGRSDHWVWLFDPAGTPLALIEASWLGRLRTGAASALAARLLGRADSRCLALLGAGRQAEGQVLCLGLSLPLTEVRVWSPRPERVRDFCRRMQPLVPPRLLPAASAAAAVAGADIVAAATKAQEPVVAGSLLAPGSLVLAVGSNDPRHRELDTEAIRRAGRLVTDSRRQAEAEAGDLIIAAAEGAAVFERLEELPAMLACCRPGRRAADEIIVFKSTGLAVQDIAVAARVYKRAVAAGRGAPLPF